MALELRRNEEGITRVRFERGWVSEIGQDNATRILQVTHSPSLSLSRARALSLSLFVCLYCLVSWSHARLVVFVAAPIRSSCPGSPPPRCPLD